MVGSLLSEYSKSPPLQFVVTSFLDSELDVLDVAASRMTDMKVVPAPERNIGIRSRSATLVYMVSWSVRRMSKWLIVCHLWSLYHRTDMDGTVMGQSARSNDGTFEFSYSTIVPYRTEQYHPVCGAFLSD